MAFNPQGTGYPQLLPEDAIYSNSVAKKFKLGMLALDINGNEYRYIQAVEGLAVGELVTPTVPATWDSTIVIDGAVAVDDAVIRIDRLTTAMTANEYEDYFVCQAPATAKGFLHRIKGHPAIAASTGDGDLSLAHPAMEIFADGTALLIYQPYRMELTDAGLEQIRGVAIGTITTDYYGFVQVSGYVNGVLCDGSNGAAVVAGEPITPYGTDPGQGQGVDASTPAEADFNEYLSPLVALEASAIDAGYVPALFIRRV